MKRVLMLYNPVAGRGHGRRLALVERAAGVLRAAGCAVRVEATRGPGVAGEQALEAAEGGCDAVIACGGDGTALDVLQGMVRAPRGAAMGVLPLGTGNALASDLGLRTRRIEEAARRLLGFVPRRVAAMRGEAAGRDGAPVARYAATMVGVGMQARMVYRMLTGRWKQRQGMAAYYGHAMRLWLTHRVEPFEVEIEEADGRVRMVEAGELLAVRIADFGRPLRRLAPGADLRRDDMRVIVIRPERLRLRYWRYLNAATWGRHVVPEGVELVSAVRVRCRPAAESARVHVQADGELLGRVPVTVTVERDAFALLTPEGRSGRG